MQRTVIRTFKRKLKTKTDESDVKVEQSLAQVANHEVEEPLSYDGVDDENGDYTFTADSLHFENLKMSPEASTPLDYEPSLLEEETTPPASVVKMESIALSPAASPLSDEEEEESIQGWGNAQLVSDILKTVMETDEHMLTAQEISSQALVVYLHLRRHPLRLTSSRYRLHIDDAVMELSKYGLLTVGPEEGTSLRELLDVLARSELEEVAKSVRVKVTGKVKDKLVGSLLNSVHNQGTFVSTGGMWRLSDSRSAERKLRGEVMKRIGPLLTLDAATSSTLESLLIIYFRPSSLPPPPSNLLTGAILHRSGRHLLPVVEFCRSKLWSLRSDFDEWRAVIELEKDIAPIAEKGKAAGSDEAQSAVSMIDAAVTEERWVKACATLQGEDSSQDYWMRKWHVAWPLGSLLNHKLLLLPLLPSFQQVDEIPLLRLLLSQKVVRLGDRGRWYDRLALTEERYGEGKLTAYSVCTQALSESEEWVGGAPKIPPTTKWGNVHYRNSEGQSVRVENYALERYLGAGWDGGCLAETGLVQMVFSLLAWDVLFDGSVDGAFWTPYQAFPNDIATPCFASRRTSQIDKWLSRVRNEGVQMVIETDHRERSRGGDGPGRIKGTMAGGVNWSSWSADDIKCVAEGLGNKGLEVIGRKLIHDIRHMNHGFPDLALWTTTPPYRVLFSEVKSPNDVLADAQKVWIEYLITNGVAAEVCRVEDGEEDTNDAREGVLSAGRQKRRKSTSKKRIGTSSDKATRAKRQTKPAVAKSFKDSLIID
ncbi:hypothetical protein HDU93_009802, partial [Gonapodya sp. JEL0774]